MAALTAVAAQIAVPLPFTPVPFTLQVLMVVLSGFLLGLRYGFLAQAVYLLLGAAGLPVFAGFSGGLGHFLTPTGGYLVAYPLAAALAGLAAGRLSKGGRRRSSRGSGVPVGIACGLLALVPIYGLGAAWLAVQSGLTPGAALAAGVLPFIPLDALKTVMATLLAAAIAPQINVQRSAVGGHRP